ncbi:hypothetical protein SAMN05192541_1418 [Bradyrhizobium arachidis]|nr:hypothetical protein SAMN05192541_1418 [Bradyrhizobium arachidis]
MMDICGFLRWCSEERYSNDLRDNVSRVGFKALRKAKERACERS